MNIKTLNNFTHNYIGLGVRKWEPPTDLTNLRLAPSIQHLTPRSVGQCLNKSSDACKYFGVDSPENILKNIRHHEKLNNANESWRTSDYSSGKIVNLGTMSLTNIEAEKRFLHKGGRIGVHGRPWTLIDEIKTQGAAKITFMDKIFGTNPSGGAHTIGLVTRDNYLYVLDSLGEGTKELKEFHQVIRELFSDAGFTDIIFSSKVQQPMNEFTCNNWTFANIKSVVNELYGQKRSIKTTEELDKILREDINNILEEQYKQAVWY